jgi:hypothetical protein
MAAPEPDSGEAIVVPITFDGKIGLPVAAINSCFPKKRSSFYNGDRRKSFDETVKRDLSKTLAVDWAKAAK